MKERDAVAGEREAVEKMAEGEEKEAAKARLAEHERHAAEKGEEARRLLCCSRCRSACAQSTTREPGGPSEKRALRVYHGRVVVAELVVAVAVERRLRLRFRLLLRIGLCVAGGRGDRPPPAGRAPRGQSVRRGQVFGPGRTWGCGGGVAWLHTGHAGHRR